jgi:uncharacterized protein YdaU (DUF1376 family)
VNFYKHHIGDYAQATSHLSFVEDAAYIRLLRKYYAEEQPIPADLKAAQRLVGARTKEEREAVQTVLEEFFTLESDGWHNKRADVEIAKAQERAETNKRIAEAREAAKKVTKRLRRGARFVDGEEHDSCSDREPSHKPDTTSQTPDESKSLESTVVDLSPGPAEPDAEDDPPGVPNCPLKAIVRLYHEVLPEMAPVRELPDQTAKMIRARWRADPRRQSLEWWRRFFGYVRTCPFLMGEKTDFIADLLWLVRPTNFAKVINGNYQERRAA